MDENLQKIDNFFKIDLIIKNIIHSSFPNSADKNNPEALIEYSKRLYNNLDKIESMFLRIINSFSLGTFIESYIISLFKNYKDEIYSCEYNYEKLRQTFIKIFAEMKEEIVDEIHSEIIGYNFFGINLSQVLKKATSISEILHIFHSYVINNEKFLQSCKRLSEKNYVELFGKTTFIATNIFETIDNTQSSTKIKIISVSDNHIIIMCRGYGHATTLDINIENESAWIEYFIPKVCNYIMVNNLPGVRKVKNDSKWTTGVVVVPTNELPSYLNDFIKKIPVDDDMHKKGGIMYTDYNQMNESLQLR